MINFSLRDSWKQAYPGAAVGVLALDQLANPNKHPELEQQKQALEADLRRRYGERDRATLRSLPTLQTYHDYYKRFRKSYHVQLQLESIVFKDKAIPRVNSLVESMFMAELKNQLLTAGHDLATVVQPFGIRVADGSERYFRINGQEQSLKEGDMFIADMEGVMSCVIYGPDRRTRIRPKTTSAVYTVYAPAGISIESVIAHLDDIASYIGLFSPRARILGQQVYTAG